MILELKSCQLRFTKAGVYLVLFTIGLASSSHVTGSNILLLLNFLLISVIIFNFIYLKRLASNSIELKLMSIIEEDFGPALEIKNKIILPLSGKLIFTWERFDQRIQTTLNILRFSNNWFIKGDSITLRGTYNLEHILLEIEFPFHYSNYAEIIKYLLNYWYFQKITTVNIQMKITKAMQTIIRTLLVISEITLLATV